MLGMYRRQKRGLASEKKLLPVTIFTTSAAMLSNCWHFLSNRFSGRQPPIGWTGRGTVVQSTACSVNTPLIVPEKRTQGSRRLDLTSSCQLIVLLICIYKASQNYGTKRLLASEFCHCPTGFISEPLLPSSIYHYFLQLVNFG